MPLRFRNIDADPTDPVELWGVEGMLTALERGTIEHWRRMTEAARFPRSRAAEELEEALELADRPLAVWWVRERLRQLRQTPAEVVAERIRLRLMESGMSRADFASSIGTSPSRLSTYLSAKVTPSAAVLVRAEDESRRAVRESVLAATS